MANDLELTVALRVRWVKPDFPLGPSMIPRDYQQASIDGFWQQAQRKPNDSQLIILPTGGGKTIVISYIAKQAALDYDLPVLLLARSSELIGQAHEKLLACFPDIADDVGIYSAKLGLRDYKQPIILATVQSLANDPTIVGPRKLIKVDEAHQIPKREESQYQKVISAIRKNTPGRVKLLGLTASPYRLDGGVIFGNGQQFDSVAHSVPLATLFEQGYLTEPKTLNVASVDLSGVRKTAGDFNKAEVESRFLGNSISAEIVAAANEKDLKSVLVFASGVAHANLLKHELQALGEDARVIDGETVPLLRATTIDLFSNRRLRWLINIDVLTTGFDAPCVDGIVVARATESPGLFYQMVGRGFRLFPGKDVCWIMDYGGNIERHGAINSPEYGMDTIKVSTGEGEAPKRICPSCFEINHASAARCYRCGLLFPRKPKELVASTKRIVEKPEWYEVIDTQFERNKGKDGKRDTLRVTHKVKAPDSPMGIKYIMEYVCLEHPQGNWGLKMAQQWWRQVSQHGVPETIDEALEIIQVIGVAKFVRVQAIRDKKFWKVVNREVSDAPPATPLDWGEDEDCPF